MKRKFIGVLGATALVAGLGLTACSSNSNSNSSNSSTSTNSASSSKTSKTENSEKRISQNKEFRDKFDKIKVGDLMSKGQGGSTVAQVKALLGTPTSTSSTKTNGMKTKGLIWVKGGSTITIGTIDDNVISKQITGFKFASRAKKLTLKAFDAVKDGSSYDSIVQKFGEPDGLDESLIMGTKTISATYLTGVKGDTGANAVFTFSNGKLTSKTQSDLK